VLGKQESNAIDSQHFRLAFLLPEALNRVLHDSRGRCSVAALSDKIVFVIAAAAMWL